MNYQTVFEITDKGYQWWFPTVGIVGTAVIFILRNVVRVPDSKRRIVRVALWFSLIWTMATFAVTFPEYYLLRKKYRAHQYSVVEGIVENFKPMPYEGHENETFTVNGMRFEYSDYAVSSGFNQTSSHGGPIKEGIQVRISHIGNVILRLEILK